MLLLFLLLEDIISQHFGNLRYFLYYLYMTEWRKVPGFERYEISIKTKEGECRSLNYRRTGKTKVFSNVKNSCGRVNWRLYKDNNGYLQQAAVWIALTYPELVENEYFEGAEIDHIDTDPLNNHPSNLRWVTRKGNQNNPLTRKHRSEVMSGKKQSEITCKRRSESMKGHKGYWTGKKFTEEHKKKLSEAHKKREP